MRDITIQQKLYYINIANSTVKVIVRVKEILIKTIMNIKTNISIITLPVVKKLKMTIGLPDESQIIVVN